MKISKKELFVFVFTIIAVFLSGCDKKEASVQENKTPMDHKDMNHEGHDHSAMMEEGAEKAMEAVGEQTICPVMGNPINKDIFVEYKGKKVYFCCPGCDKIFKEDPEKYLAKLPQFGGKEEAKK